MSVTFVPGTDVGQFLDRYERHELLRFLTCGSVDDGKSTLIGRLLHDTGRVFEDHMRAVVAESKVHGTRGGEVDLALLVDGLKAEREQGITIDVAWRYFSSAKRSFIIADCPGHEQYTRNMATGASHCQLAITLIDARHGVTSQTRRHAFIAALLGIRHVVACVNKMDLAEWSPETFRKVESDFRALCAHLGIADPVAIPISALQGDNVALRSERMKWYSGPTVMELLDSVPVEPPNLDGPFRMPVQQVFRPDLDFRGFAGSVESGSIRAGERVRVLPSGKSTRLRRIATADGDRPVASAGDAVVLTFEDEVDCSRGDVIAGEGGDTAVAKRFEADLVWMSEQPLQPGSQWILRAGTRTTSARVRAIHWEHDIDALAERPAVMLALNAIGRVEIECEEPIAITSYSDCRGTGALILVDRLTCATVGAGMIRLKQGMRQSHWDTRAVAGLVERPQLVRLEDREQRHAQRPVTLLLCGMPGAGKAKLAHQLNRRLFDAGHAAVVLDGQSMRRSLSRDLGFDPRSRSENLRRAMEVSRLLNDQGLIAICSMVAPQQEARDKARLLVGSERFVLIHVEGGSMNRDDGEVRFEVPQEARITVRADEDPAAAAQRIAQELTRGGFLK
ncbi:MAG: sulfate adenylyltransferase subunit CysN [Planctomycetes bacterium]|nr:sulfate adenylyltransferase subunit CysN [Planctomycetota bacterium]